MEYSQIHKPLQLTIKNIPDYDNPYLENIKSWLLPRMDYNQKTSDTS